MANYKKDRINPYLFILLKRMLHFEFVGLGEEPSGKKIAYFLYGRHKSEEFAQTHYDTPPDKRDKAARKIADGIFEYFLREKDFFFSADKLNALVKEITLLGTYDSWEDFRKAYGKDAGAIMAEVYYMDRNFSEYTQDEQQEVISDANMMLYKLAASYYKTGRKKAVNTIAKTSEYVIRTVATEEIKDIERLAKRIYPCPINSFDVKKPWFEKNPNIFYIYRDDYCLWANINLLPLKEEFVDSLREGRKYENEIRAADIYSLQERQNVRHIYVEGLACALREVLPLFGHYFRNMICSLAESEDLVICAIGGSVEGDTIMKNLGFEQTGWAVDANKHKYAFLEIPFKLLIANVSKKMNVLEGLASLKRLSKISRLN